MMKYKKIITILVVCIVILGAIAALSGIFSAGGTGEYQFTSIHGQSITIYGKGIYKNNSTASVMQAIPQDIVTLALGIPMLVISLFLARKGLIKGRLLLAGVVGYFLVTYSMYIFIAMYNRLFLIYTALISISFFTFMLTLMSFDVDKLKTYFNKKLPVKFVGGFLLFASVMVGLLWLSRIMPTLINGTTPVDLLEHGTTLPVQAIDLAFFLPSIFIAGILIIKRKAMGYLLAPVATFFLIFIMTALFSKGVSMTITGAEGTLPMMIMTSIFDVIAILSSIIILKNIKEPSNGMTNK